MNNGVVTWRDNGRVEAFSTYYLNLICTHDIGNLKLEATFDESQISKLTVSKMLGRFNTILQQLASTPLELSVAEVNVLSSTELDQL